MRGLLYGGFISSRITTLSRLVTVGLWELLTPDQKGKIMIKNIKIKLRDYLINNLVEQGYPIYFDSQIICTAYEGLFDSCYVLHKHDCEK